MAPLPANTTARIYLDYVTSLSATATEHTLSVRYNEAIGNVAAQEAALAFLTALTPGRLAQDWRIIRCRNQGAGTNFSVPVGLIPGLVAFNGTGSTLTLEAEALELRFVGRSFTSGRRASVSVYGISSFPLDNSAFRLTAADDPTIGDAITALRNAQPDAFVCIDGSQASWYSYANWQYNQFWESELRS
jgi:hypothetical protein